MFISNCFKLNPNYTQLICRLWVNRTGLRRTYQTIRLGFIFGQGCPHRWSRSGLPNVRSTDSHLPILTARSTHARTDTTRKPITLLRLPGVFLLRNAERQNPGLLFQEPLNEPDPTIKVSLGEKTDVRDSLDETSLLKIRQKIDRASRGRREK